MADLLPEKELLQFIRQPLVPPAAVRSFDAEATALLAAYQLAGWRGTLTANGHVLLRAPDGVSTTSISRSSLRGRSGRNAAAALKRWRREHPLDLVAEVDQRAKQVKVTAFGPAQREQQMTYRALDIGGTPMPIAAQAEMKRSERLQAWFEAGPAGEVLLIVDDDEPRSWVVGEAVAGRDVRVVAHGSALADAQAAYVCLIDHDARARLMHDRYVRKSMSRTEPLEAAVKVFQCDQCDQSFPGAQALAGHKVMAHAAHVICPACGREFTSAARLGVHRSSRHFHGRCEECGREFTSKAALTRHACAARVAGPTDNAVAVTPDVTPDTPDGAGGVVVQPGEGVLADHLLHLPQGADAEQMVAAIRAIVAAPLVGEVQRLRAERDDLQARVDLLVKEKEESAARMALLREALNA